MIADPADDPATTIGDVLLVGAGDPAARLEAPLANLSDSLRWVTPEPAELGDDYLDRLVAAEGPAGEGLTGEGFDLVIHALYPAASRIPAPLLELTEAQWRVLADQPLEAGIRLARSAHPYLLARRGVLLFLVPLVAPAGAAGLVPLATAAEGLRILARSLAKGWGEDGIRVHAITLDPAMFLDPGSAATAGEAYSLSPPGLGRLPGSSEIVELIRYLAAPSSSGLTGTSLVMDGGRWMTG